MNDTSDGYDGCINRNIQWYNGTMVQWYNGTMVCCAKLLYLKLN